MTAATSSSPTTVISMSTPTTTPSSMLNDQAQDIPIFLRKTYHMIDTCDPTVACWSEDGETFVVKDPVKFETNIIPQFFKHSKFSSFVRQLNFYAFRKIKYADTIRIDPKLEAETANYWRFRHEKFQRGKPELLGEIKRMNGTKQQPKPKESLVLVGGSPDKENSILKTEVTTLKQRIEAMSKNIDDLSSMVQKVTLFSQNAPQTVNANNKRTKVEEPKPPIAACTPLPDEMLSSSVVSPDTTSMELDDLVPLPPSIPSPSPVERATTSTSELSDEGFVDQLFTAFKTEDFEFDESESVLPTPVLSVPVHQQQQEMDTSDRPRPELMSRLSDALAVLPRDIQEMIVDRLIEAITSPKEIQDNITAANTLKEVGGMMTNCGKGGKALPSAVPQSPKQTQDEHKQNNPLGLNLAAATLAALLSQYGNDNDTKPSSNAIKNSDLKALLIPVHA